MRFNYQARTKEGEIKTGVVEASSKEIALILLQKYGFYVTFLEEEKKVPFYARELKIFRRVSLKDVVLFSRQLSIMFGSKVPLVECLSTLGNQTQNIEFKEKIFDLLKEVEGGSSLSKALARYPKIFSPFYIAMVKAGEDSGTLSQSLNYLADHLEREHNIRSKTITAMIYPCLVIIVFLTVLFFMMFSILPSFEKIFIEAKVELPQSTKIALEVSSFFKKNWLLLLLLVFSLPLSFFGFYRTQKGKEILDRIFLRLPIIGSILKQLSISRIAENLSTLISGGLLITRALELVAEIAGNSLYKNAIISIREEVRKGTPISSTSVLYPEIFPPLFTQMVLTGEKTGTLDSCLMHIASFYQKEAERAIDNLLKVLEPLLIILLGALIGGLMLLVLIPLYKLIGAH